MFRFVCIAAGVFVCGPVFAGKSTDTFHLLAKIGCAQGLVDGRADVFQLRDSVATQQLKDLRLINALWSSIEKLDGDLNHSKRLRQPPSLVRSERVISTPKRQLLRFVDNVQNLHGADQVVALYGEHYLTVLANDDDHATHAAIYLESLKAAYIQMAAIAQYIYLWRESWVSHLHLDTNQSIALWMRNLKFRSNDIFQSHREQISQMTEATVAKSGSRSYSPRKGEELVEIANWEKHIDTDHLPELGQRAASYIRANLDYLPIVYTPILQGAVSRAAARIRALDSVTH